MRTTGLTVSPDSQTMAVGNHVGTVHIVNIESREVVVLDASQQLASARFSRDGERLLTFGNDGLIRVWDWRTRTLLYTLRSHDAHVGDVSLSPDGARLLSTVSGDEPILWDLHTAKPLLRMNLQGTAIHLPLFAPDGHRIFARWGGTTVVAFVGKSRTPAYE